MIHKRPEEKKAAPTVIVVFGVTGDLSQRKLMPALLDLYIKKLLPLKFKVVGFSRREMTDVDFKKFLQKAINRKKHNHKKKQIDQFLNHFTYQQGAFDKAKSYLALGEKLIEIDGQFGVCSSKLFYLATPPNLYKQIFVELANSGLSIPCVGKDTGSPREAGWTRILVEKPFGRDSKTAFALDQALGKLFKEDQIFRIDHYLAKETLQNVMMFRFSNKLFEPIWNNKHIEKVEIKLLEKMGVEQRGAFYHDVGALRDVGQNHMLQMLASIAMEDPEELNADTVRKQRVKVLESLKPITGVNITKKTLRGQYQGFHKEKNVPSGSKTETYFRLEAEVDNDRWKGVPFILEGGKGMKNKSNEIKIYFKQTESCFCPPGSEQYHQNILTFRIQPNEGISVLFWAKIPGFTLDLEPKDLSFRYEDSKEELMIPEPYEQVLYDCIIGNQLRFLSTNEVAAAWKFITPILEKWKKTKLHIYKQGSLGPHNK